MFEVKHHNEDRSYTQLIK